MLRDEPEQKATKRAKVQGIPAHEALNASLAQGQLGTWAQDQCQLWKTDGALHAKCYAQAHHELEPRLKDREMLAGQVCERPIV